MAREEEDDLGEVFVEGKKLRWEVRKDSAVSLSCLEELGRVRAEGLRINRVRKGWAFGKKCGNGLRRWARRRVPPMCSGNRRW